MLNRLIHNQFIFVQKTLHRGCSNKPSVKDGVADDIDAYQNLLRERFAKAYEGVDTNSYQALLAFLASVFACGNCNAQAALLLIQSLTHGDFNESIEYVNATGRHVTGSPSLHALVVYDRVPYSNLQKPETWGHRVIIADTWGNTIHDATINGHFTLDKFALLGDLSCIYKIESDRYEETLRPEEYQKIYGNFRKFKSFLLQLDLTDFRIKKILSKIDEKIYFYRNRIAVPIHKKFDLLINNHALHTNINDIGVSNAERYIKLAHAIFINGNHKMALHILSQLIQKGLCAGKANLLSANINYANENYEYCIKLYKRAIKRNTTLLPSDYQNYAYALTKVGFYKDAKKISRNNRVILPELCQSLNGRGRVK